MNINNNLKLNTKEEDKEIKLKDLIEKEKEKQNKNNEKIIKIIGIFFIISILCFIFYGIFIYYKDFNNNLNNFLITKDILLGNINNEKGNINNNFKVSIGGKTYQFNNFEEFKNKIIEIYNNISNFKYNLIGEEDNKIIFNETKTFNELGYFLNISQLSDFVKSNITNKDFNTESGIIVELSKFSYIDNKKILDFKNNVIKKYIKDVGLISFDKEKGFYIEGNNYSYYTMNVIKEDIKKINLDFPENINSKITFKIEKTDINEKINKLNNIFNKIKTFNLVVFFDSKSNEKNLKEILKYFKGYKKEIDKNGLKVYISGNKFLEGIKYINGGIVYEDLSFFNSGNINNSGIINVKPSNSSIVVNNPDFFTLKTPLLQDNYPSSNDFVKIIKNNGFSFNLNSLNSKINNYFRYQLTTNFIELKPINELKVDIIITPNEIPIVNINKVIGKNISILDKTSVYDIYTKNGLYDFNKKLKIKDTKKIIDEYNKKNLKIQDIEYSIGSIFKINEDDCKISSMDKGSFAITCNSPETLNLIGINGMNKTINGNTIVFSDFSGDGSQIYIYDNIYNIEYKYIDIPKDFEHLYESLNNNYIKIDKSIIKDIKYNEIDNNFEIYFQKNGDYWYLKTSQDYDNFLIFFISLE